MLKELSKKLRWKWHRDIIEQMSKQHNLMQQQLSDRQLSLENDVTKIKQDLSQIRDAQSALEAQRQTFWGLDSFVKRVEAEEVFSLLRDRESQKLFWARLNYTQNGNLAPLMQHLMQMDRTGNPVDIISMLRDRLNGVGSDKELIIFGTTRLAKELFLAVRTIGLSVDFICREDNCEQYTLEHIPPLSDYDWLGVPVISEAELLDEHRNAQLLIGDLNEQLAQEVLIERGFPAEQVWRHYSMWETQYLDPEIMHPHKHEVYVDGGVLNLGDTLEFINWCDGEYDAVYAFEPDKWNYSECVRRMKKTSILDDERIHLFHAALWKRDEELKFEDGNAGSSCVGAWGANLVPGRSLDSVLNGERVTFLKLDIEGSELAALEGAKETIKKWKPRLAICIYHKPEDPIEIPLYIHSLVPEYKMYIRHYSTYQWETVLYCICDSGC